MNGLDALVRIDNLFTTFIAPPGWGKTRMLLDFYEQGVNKIVFVAPLRALAEEFAAAVGKGAIVLRPKCEREQLLKKFQQKNRAFLITTPELIDLSLINIISEQSETLVVLDEFHLYYYWGHSFRPLMWEACMGLVNNSSRILALSATMDKGIMEQWKEESLLIDQQQVVVDLGNQCLKYHPSMIYYYYSLFKGRLALRLTLINSVLRKDKGTTLLFVRLRHQVDFWVEFFSRRGVEVLGCKGGMVVEFIDELDMDNPPRLIVATTAISHGVNLPPISQIYIDYPTKSKDFWIQMVGRGGRRGESFSVHTLDFFMCSGWRGIYSAIISGIRGAYLAILHYFDL